KRVYYAERQQRMKSFTEGAWWLFVITFVVVGAMLFAQWQRSQGIRFITPVEVLVIFAVIGMLVALLQPAVQAAREAGRGNSAMNEMKQIGLSLLRYEDERTRDTPIAAVDEMGMSPAVHVRDWFPETFLWRPEIITDDQGRASIEVPLADSITTW